MENTRESDVIEIDLLEIFGLLMDRIWLILSAGLFTALVGCLISAFFLTPTYESTTRIYILNKDDNKNITTSDLQMGSQLTKDYAELINSRYVLEGVISRMGIDLSYEELKNKIDVATPADTRILSITVKDTDPIKAMDTANCIREVASEHIQNVMDIEAVNIVETANMPTKKAGPSVKKWTLLGGAIGLLLVCGVILIQYLLNDSIKSSEDVEKYLGLSTLGLIPVLHDENGAGRRNKRKKGRRA